MAAAAPSKADYEPASRESVQDSETDSLYDPGDVDDGAPGPSKGRTAVLRQRLRRAWTAGQCGKPEVCVLAVLVLVLVVFVVTRVSALTSGSPEPESVVIPWLAGGGAPAAAPVGGSCPGTPAPSGGIPRGISGRIPIIFDSDFGSYMDDSFALSYALGCPEISVELAIAVGGTGTNPIRRARCLGRHMNDAGRGHIPLASGPPANGPGITNLEAWCDSLHFCAFTFAPISLRSCHSILLCFPFNYIIHLFIYSLH